MSKLDRYTLECVRSVLHELRKDAYESEEISALNAVDLELTGMLELATLDLEFPDTRAHQETRARLLAMGVSPAFFEELDHSGLLPLDEFLENVKATRPVYATVEESGPLRGDLLDEKIAYVRHEQALAVDRAATKMLLDEMDKQQNREMEDALKRFERHSTTTNKQ